MKLSRSSRLPLPFYRPFSLPEPNHHAGKALSSVDTGVDGSRPGGPQFFRNILNPEPRVLDNRSESGWTAPQERSLEGSLNLSSGQNGNASSKLGSVVNREPTDLDFEIYATNTMEGYEPPAPPLPPFGGVNEEYWGEVFGEDPWPKDPNANRSSLLAYLDTLNAAKPEGDDNSQPFRSTSLRRNRPLEGSRASRPIRLGNIRANRPIQEPKPIDSYRVIKSSESLYDASRNVDNTPRSEVPSERRIILGDSKLLGPLPGYGVADEEPVYKNTEAETTPAIEEMEPSAWYTMITQGGQNNSSGASDKGSVGHANPSEITTNSQDGNGAETTRPAQSNIILGNSKYMEPLSWYPKKTQSNVSDATDSSAGQPKPTEKTPYPFVEEDGAGATRPIESGATKPAQRDIILGNSKYMEPLSWYPKRTQAGETDATDSGDAGQVPTEKSPSDFTDGDGAGATSPIESGATRPAQRDIILGNSKYMEPLSWYPKKTETDENYVSDGIDSGSVRQAKSWGTMPGYGAGQVNSAERDTRFDQSISGEGNGAKDTKPVERTTILGGSTATDSISPNGLSDAKPWDGNTGLGKHSSFGEDSAVDMNRSDAGAVKGSGSGFSPRAVDGAVASNPDLGSSGFLDAEYVDNTQDSVSINKSETVSGTSRALDSKPLVDQDRWTGGGDGDAQSRGSSTSDAKLADRFMDPTLGKSSVSQSRPLEMTSSMVPKPADSVVDTMGVNGFRTTSPGEDSMNFNLDGNSGSASFLGSATTQVNPSLPSEASYDSVGAVQELSVVRTQSYAPNEKDIVLGAVISASDQKLDLEIGAEQPALMLSRDLGTSFESLDNIFFKLPSDEDSQSLEGFVAPVGKSLIVEDLRAYDGASPLGSVVHVGTVVTAEVQGLTLGEGRAILSVRPPAKRIAWHRIKQLMQMDEAINIEITQWNDGGLLGFVQGIRAFLPRSELLQRPESVATLRGYVGRTLPVLIIRAEEEAGNMIISECKAWMRKYLRLGTVHDATVTKLYSYGMQVEVNNTRIRGFVHISNMSREFVKRVSDLFSEGESVKVMLIRGRDSQQISFSIAELESDRGLILRDKERVFREAEDVARKFREDLREDDQIFGQFVHDFKLEFEDPVIANMKWLDLADEISMDAEKDTSVVKGQ